MPDILDTVLTQSLCYHRLAGWAVLPAPPALACGWAQGEGAESTCPGVWGRPGPRAEHRSLKPLLGPVCLAPSMRCAQGADPPSPMFTCLIQRRNLD